MWIADSFHQKRSFLSLFLKIIRYLKINMLTMMIQGRIFAQRLMHSGGMFIHNFIVGIFFNKAK